MIVSPYIVAFMFSKCGENEGKNNKTGVFEKELMRMIMVGTVDSDSMPVWLYI
jgi:hypothetical protein